MQTTRDQMVAGVERLGEETLFGKGSFRTLFARASGLA